MFIFAIFSIPITFLLFVEKKTSKNIVLFFFGCVISSILSLLFWAISTLYIYDSDSLFNKFVIYFISNVIPIIILSISIIYTFFSSIKKLDLSYSFISGFLYFNLLFSIFTNAKYDIDLITLYLPFVYMFCIYYINKIKNFEFKEKSRLYKSLLYLLIPLYFMFAFIIFKVSMVLSIIFLVLLLFSIIILKMDLWNLKSRLLNE